MIILLRSNIRSNLIPAVKQQIITTLPFILLNQGVKRILEQLKKNGQYDNTIILFTSDNGAVIDGPLPLNGAQKGYKSQTYPGGTHTPNVYVVERKNLQPGNYDKLISAMDFYPTALDAADISIPKALSWMAFPCCPGCKIRNRASHIKNLTWINIYSHWFDEEKHSILG